MLSLLHMLLMYLHDAYNVRQTLYRYPITAAQ